MTFDDLILQWKYLPQARAIVATIGLGVALYILIQPLLNRFRSRK